MFPSSMSTCIKFIHIIKCQHFASKSCKGAKLDKLALNPREIVKYKTLQNTHPMCKNSTFNMFYKLSSVAICVAGLISLVAGHGYIADPAARQFCSRSIKKCTEVHWTPDELNCGGFSVQNDQNGGKCGVCGDAYHHKNPAFVYPGKYAKGVITGVYKEGQQIDVKVINTTLSTQPCSFGGVHKDMMFDAE